MHASTPALAVFLLTGLSLAACASEPRPGAITPAAPAMRSSPPVGVLRASGAYPEWSQGGSAAAIELGVASGKDQGKGVRLVDRPGTDAGAAPGAGFIIDWFAANENSPRTERTLVRDADGGLAMPRIVDRDHKVITTFDPPMPLFPASLAAGKPVQSKSSVVVYDLNNPKHVKERGSASVTIEYTGDVALPRNPGDAPAPAATKNAGSLHAVSTLVQTSFPAAKSERKSVQWFSDERGLEAESYEETITALGVVIERTRQTLVRPGGAGEAAAARAGAGAGVSNEPSRTDQSSGGELLRDTSRSVK